MKLCKVMGIDMEHDPDDTYELTTDNVKKMLAIYMRFRCDIPVIIMGETGCGKTRLIKFMCALQMPPGLQPTNMILVKVHGGTTYDDIKREVAEAERIAQENTEKYEHICSQIRDDLLPDVPKLIKVVSDILTASQYYMREQKDECSFVSLRDVDRVLSMMSWFYAQSQGERTLYKLMDKKFDGDDQVDDLTRSLILALGVCYHACLRKRKGYRHYIAHFFRQPCELTNGGDQIKNEIE
ncbi:E3 ubiquitin-protein ligase rnf213-beta-like, partial [Ruditapes philippinarum]|uniref:E3 ubiquitin-protein ligase rnf213-beta-like n=1 Tax=Ruditapes philippinarum TaxID=129788 RepID=UPI00295B83AE